MFEFFVALFGGLYYGGKYISEKHKERVADEAELVEKLSRTQFRIEAGADYDLESWAKEYVQCGENYEAICNEFEAEFRYVFGDDWENKLCIPNGYRRHRPIRQSPHSYWVYHMLLAKRGKMDHWHMMMGYDIGGLDEKDIDIKFAYCIEKLLHEAGFKHIQLVLKLEEVGGYRRSPAHVCGGKLVVKGIEYCPTARLW